MFYSELPLPKFPRTENSLEFRRIRSAIGHSELVNIGRARLAMTTHLTLTCGDYEIRRQDLEALLLSKDWGLYTQRLLICLVVVVHLTGGFVMLRSALPLTSELPFPVS